MADLNLRIDRDAYQPPERPEKKVVVNEAVDPLDSFYEMFAEEITGEKREPVREIRQPQVRQRTRRAELPQPQPVLQEEVIIPAQSHRERNYIDRSADRLSAFIGETGGATQLNEVEERFHILEAEISKIRQMTKAAFPGDTGRNLVSGIGQGGDGQLPGSGAVWLWDLDDVDIGTPYNGQYPDITDGSVLVYDASDDKWKPGDGGGPGEHESNLQTGGIIQKDGGAVNNTGELIIKQDATGDGGDLKLQSSGGSTWISLYSSSGRIANIHRLADTPSLELGQCGPAGSRLPVIGLENGAPTGTNTAPRLTLLNSHTQTPQADGLGNLRYNLTIKAGTQSNMRIERGTNNGGWTSLYIEGKTVNYDPNAAGTNFNSTNDPKKYPLINLFRSNDNSGGHVADAINYRGRTDSQYYLQTQESVQALINSGGGGVGFEFSGTVNVTNATTGTQPTHTGDLTDPTPGAFYINTTAGEADDSWTGIAGLQISADQLIIWSEQGQRWFAGAVEDNTSFLKINGTNNMLEALNVVLNTPAEGASNAALTIRKQGDSQAKTTIYAGGSMDVGGTIKCSANIIPANAGQGNVGTQDSKFSEVNADQLFAYTDGSQFASFGPYGTTPSIGGTNTRFGTVYCQGVNTNSTSTIGALAPATIGSTPIGADGNEFGSIYFGAAHSNATSYFQNIVPKDTSGNYTLGLNNARWFKLFSSSVDCSGTVATGNVTTTDTSTMAAIHPKSNGGFSLGATNTRWNTLFANSLNLSGGSFNNSGTLTQSGISTFTGDMTVNRLTVNMAFNASVTLHAPNLDVTSSTAALTFSGNGDTANITVSGKQNKALQFYATDGSGGSGTSNRCMIIAYEENESVRPFRVNNIRMTPNSGTSKLKGDVENGTFALIGNNLYIRAASTWYKVTMSQATPPT